MTRADEISKFMLNEFKIEEIEDTPQNRIVFLKGLQEEWKRDEDSSIEKSLFQMALSAMIFTQEMQLIFPIKIG